MIHRIYIEKHGKPFRDDPAAIYPPRYRPKCLIAAPASDDPATLELTPAIDEEAAVKKAEWVLRDPRFIQASLNYERRVYPLFRKLRLSAYIEKGISELKLVKALTSKHGSDAVFIFSDRSVANKKFQQPVLGKPWRRLLPLLHASASAFRNNAPLVYPKSKR